jgi:CDP-diacylglycerol--serine O-phosphatidyltransferase
MTNTTSAFGLQFDSLADVISFGIAPAVLAFAWGLADLGRVGWATGFLFVTAAAMRLARFNLQSPTLADKRFFIGMPSPAAAGVVASTVYAWPYPLGGYPQSIAAVAVVLIPAILMVITLRFRSFKNLNFGWMGSYMPIFIIAAFIVLIATKPNVTLVLIAYGYLLSAFVEFAINRLRSHRVEPPVASP